MSTLAQRSVLDRSGYSLDTIHIAGIAARGFHGVLESEREAGQDFSADVTLYLDTRPAARGDDLTETVNYALVAQDVADILSGAPVNLIETVAEQIAAAVLDRPTVVAVDVTVHKPQAPIPVPFADVVVSIHRDRVNSAVVASPVGAEAAAQATPATDEAPELAVAAERVDTQDEAAPEWQAPVPTTTAAFPLVISRPAEPEDGHDAGTTRLDAPLDAPLDARLDAPLDAPAPFVPPVLPSLDVPVTLAAVAAPAVEVPAVTNPVMPPVPFPASSGATGDETAHEAEPTPEPAPAFAAKSAAEPEAEPALDAEPGFAAEPEVEPTPDAGEAPEVVEPAPATSPVGIGLTAVLPPLDEGVLAEQARLSEQARRPEVFGMAALSDWAPPVTADEESAASLTAPEDFLTAETFTLDDVASTPAPDVEEAAVVVPEADELAVSDELDVTDEPTVAADADAAHAADAATGDAAAVTEAETAEVPVDTDVADEATIGTSDDLSRGAHAAETATPADGDLDAGDPHEDLSSEPTTEAFDAPQPTEVVERPAYEEAPTAILMAVPVASEPDATQSLDATDAAQDAPQEAEDAALMDSTPAESPYEDDPNATTVLPRTFDRMDAVPTEPVDVVLALGANLGDAQDTLRRAVTELASISGLTITAVGPLARTAPVGGPDQPDFLNTVVLATTTLSPRDLLHACQSIEAGHGRERTEHWGPRTLDIDLITYGALVHSSDDLDIPHPRANERAFVLAPWAHLSPDAVLPGLGGGPVGALAATAPDRDGIRWLALDWLTEPESAGDRDDQPSAVPPAPPL